MSLHFLVDGYNAINQIDSLRQVRILKDARNALIRNIQAKRMMRSKINKVTVVFDGKKGERELNSFPEYEQKNARTISASKSQLNIIFSKGESADELIKRMVQESCRPKQMVVVSSDKGIVYFTRSLGARAVSPVEFLCAEQARLRPKKQTAEEGAESQKVELTYQQQEAINQELRRIWK